MHLLFQGITKASRQSIYMWITETNMVKGLSELSKDVFCPIGNMRLDWCKLLARRNESKWVSDNYFVLLRVIKWYYYPFVTLQPDKPYVEYDIPVSQWHVKICRDWLSAHECDTNG